MNEHIGPVTIHSVFCPTCGGWSSPAITVVSPHASHICCDACQELLLGIRHVEPEVWSNWIDLETINGWESIPHFPLRFRTRMRLEGTEAEITGSVTGGRKDTPIAVMPNDVIPPWRSFHRVTDMDEHGRMTRSQKITVDERGFLFVKERGAL